MNEIAPYLMAGSAAIPFVLGSLHLLYTFRGRKLWPRDPELQARMAATAPVISRELTMWQAWVGFNASHSFGAMLFGLVYGYLALLHPQFLFASRFLLGLGLVLLCAYAVVAKRYWFRVPLRGLLLSLGLYVLGLVPFAF